LPVMFHLAVMAAMPFLRPVRCLRRQTGQGAVMPERPCTSRSRKICGVPSRARRPSFLTTRTEECNLTVSTTCALSHPTAMCTASSSTTTNTNTSPHMVRSVLSCKPMCLRHTVYYPRRRNKGFRATRMALHSQLMPTLLARTTFLPPLPCLRPISNQRHLRHMCPEKAVKAMCHSMA